MIVHLVIGGKVKLRSAILLKEQYVNATNRFTSMLSTD